MAEGETPEAADRTEAPTPRRIEKARQEGQVALSREVVGLASLLAATLGAGLVLPPLAADLLRAMRGLFESAHLLTPDAALRALGWSGVVTVLPVAGFAALGAVAATLLQSGGLLSAKPLTPQLARLSPLAGLKRLFGSQGLAEFLRTLAKLGIVGLALWFSFADPARLLTLLHLPPGLLLSELGGQSLALLRGTLIAFAGVALLDLLWVRHQHLRQLRMSRQDLREEAKESEGDPQVKGRLRQLRQRAARRRMLAAVPKAAVVITNPTHFAVALAYEQGSTAAPKLVAKGADAMAARIRAAAVAAGVPVVANPPLARALFRLEVDTEIPPEHYQAVAEIIAFVWRVRGRTLPTSG
jgi:flagellar biosynthetic protein FlhB